MDRKCCYCAQTEDEMRPYGPGGAWVCFACATSPDRMDETRRQMDRAFDEAAAASELGGIVLGHPDGPQPLTERDLQDADVVATFTPEDLEDDEDEGILPKFMDLSYMGSMGSKSKN